MSIACRAEGWKIGQFASVAPGLAGIVFFRSAPAAECPLAPRPVTTAAQISGLSRISSQQSVSAAIVSGSSAFIASGRVSVTVATRSATSNETASVVKSAMPAGYSLIGSERPLV